jgi:hypothetical protein
MTSLKSTPVAGTTALAEEGVTALPSGCSDSDGVGAMYEEFI